MSKVIKPFNPQDPEILSNVAHIRLIAPVRNLTDDEILTTLRLIQLQVGLVNEFGEVWVEKNDQRLSECDDKDRFLAMLLECDRRELVLMTRKCIRLFGGTVYHWRKIGRTCPISTVASALSEYDAGYFGRGWVIAPQIVTLRRWIIQHSDNENIKKLRV